MAELESAIFKTDDVCFIQVEGHSGVGKSHLIREMAAKILITYGRELKRDPAFMPIAAFRVHARGRFSWGGFFEDYLAALCHPEPKSRDACLARTKIEAAVKARRTKIVFVDEAHHIFADSNDREAVRRQFEVLKSLFGTADMKLVFAGSFDFSPVKKADSGTQRRCRVVDFPRYDGTERGAKSFRMALKRVQKHWSDVLGFELAKYHDEILQQSGGCIGRLRTWLERAQAKCVRDAQRNRTFCPGTVITKADFDVCRPIVRVYPAAVERARLRARCVARAWRRPARRNGRALSASEKSPGAR